MDDLSDEELEEILALKHEPPHPSDKPPQMIRWTCQICGAFQKKVCPAIWRNSFLQEERMIEIEFESDGWDIGKTDMDGNPLNPHLHYCPQCVAKMMEQSEKYKRYIHEKSRKSLEGMYKVSAEILGINLPARR